MGVIVINVDAGRLREPAAWLMVAAASGSVLVGIERLLFGSSLGGSSFALRAAVFLQQLVSPVTIALLVGAVLLAGGSGPATARLKPMVYVAVATLGLAVLFGAIGLLGGVFAGDTGFMGKVEFLLLNVPVLALAVLAALFLLPKAANAPAGAARPVQSWDAPGFRPDGGFGGRPAEYGAAPAYGTGPQPHEPAPQAPFHQPQDRAPQGAPVPGHGHLETPVQGNGFAETPAHQAPAQGHAFPETPAQGHAFPEAPAPQAQYSPPSPPALPPAPSDQYGRQPESAYAPQEGSHAAPQQENGYASQGSDGHTGQASAYGTESRPHGAAAEGSPYGGQNEGPHRAASAESGLPYGATPENPFGTTPENPFGTAPENPYGASAESRPYGAPSPGYDQVPAQHAEPQAYTPSPYVAADVKPQAPVPYEPPAGSYEPPAQAYAAPAEPFPPAQSPSQGYEPAAQSQGYETHAQSPGYESSAQVQGHAAQSQGAPQGYGDSSPSNYVPQPTDPLLSGYGQQGESYGQPQGEPQSHPLSQDPFPASQPAPYTPADSRPRLSFDAQPQGSAFPQPPENYGQPLTGYSGAEFARQSDPGLPYPDPADPRSQQIAQAYQQAESYQQSSGTEPQLRVPEYTSSPGAGYDDPFGHPQTPQAPPIQQQAQPQAPQPGQGQPWEAPAEATLRFDPGAYRNDPLNAPGPGDQAGTAGRGWDSQPIDPTAIYTPERPGQATGEENLDRERTGPGQEPNMSWYGSDRREH
ncbi:hypothetical protein Ppa06_17120 [Planomonospora parontospora subsp. parontospora]|uniref:Uncharacterized protein n=2 Tax=Planomonospora parontospora TaxID=58119 RepID=A0AA37BED3_9ACTN|nr:hypothetical protein [Planomonospora parontospora]GGK58531.1 hypothetical protein GCM10010126_17670 [Planomonospora parontospora]GII07914.1 hypothetical protein Ppa06_17120 [Planomonospora parontospora subsp. parontospora]